MNHYLFSYGTLQKEQVQLETFGRLLHGTEDALVGFRLEKVLIKDPNVVALSNEPYHPIAIPTGTKKDLIHGLCFKISVQELEHADTYEVADYKRIKTTLHSGKEAWVYIKSY
ncbi:UDP-N-acetylmuramate--alanine ligase [Dokdonia pacifica]|uniref:Gamma-glutamyl cyclotransferase, AIG2-like n=1 Tax=Dokdonia pacifica TaxID=1627892 RepID=A0A238ZAV4_9FLAO|nr:gamma-glutamylcyclotransferase family protein [Dokdonia pacifica]GGG05224.1 UDP-N-acetylmuramate--alanine ligase [Dokdonia pacifica]SNR80189.1 Gamma-glutamyl cyclotransferase, AIG2-like [Dokdonia pacifica]